MPRFATPFSKVSAFTYSQCVCLGANRFLTTWEKVRNSNLQVAWITEDKLLVFVKNGQLL